MRPIAWIAAALALPAIAAATYLATTRVMTPLPQPTTFDDTGDLIALTGSWRMSIDRPNTTGIICSLPARTCQIIITEFAPGTIGNSATLSLVDRMFPIVETSATSTIAQTRIADDDCAVDTLRIDRVQQAATITIEPKLGVDGCGSPVVLIGMLLSPPGL